MSNGDGRRRLPEPFSDLDQFVERWAQPTEAGRNRVRLESSMESIHAFYHAMLPRMDVVLEYLNRYPVEEIPEEGQPLFHLACAFMEVSPAVELFFAPDVPDGFPSDRLRIEENESFAGERLSSHGARNVEEVDDEA